jgi:hypothetical protein
MAMPVYKQHKDREQRISSAVTAINALLPLDLYAAHKRELLGICIWKITEADGKTKVRYWSKGAIGGDRQALQHEHVHERKELIHRLLSGEPVDVVIKDAVACMVTKEEHRRLGQSDESGWFRYNEAGIQVYDSREQEWLNGGSQAKPGE